MRWSDGRADYGWISIILHWIGAGLILVLLFVGNSIRSPQGAQTVSMLRLHTTIALSMYLLLWARVAWRFRVGHPKALPTQKPFSYGLGKITHFVLLLALGSMLISGPLMAWTGAIALYLGPLQLPAPPLQNAAAFGLSWKIHVAGATVLGFGALVHALAVIKHTAIDRDGAFDRMMVPAGPPQVFAGEDAHQAAPGPVGSEP